MMLRGQTTIEIGGKERLLKFGINASAVASEAAGKDLHELGASTASFRYMIYGALVAGAHKSKQVVDFDVYDVGDWLEDLDEDAYAKINEVITASVPKDDGKPTTKKK